MTKQHLHKLASEFSHPKHEFDELVFRTVQAICGRTLSRLELHSLEFFSELSGQLSADFFDELRIRCDRRRTGEPLQHITGVQTFIDHDYEVNSAVLIPRPETEILVEVASVEIENLKLSSGLEIGLGSGVISIELLSRISIITMVATEVSNGAIAVAKKNRDQILEVPARLEIISVPDEGDVIPSSLFSASETARQVYSFDFIISNPPYLSDETEVTDEVQKYEPKLALFGPKQDVSFFYREMARLAGSYFQNSGVGFFEIPHERSDEIKAIFEAANWKQVRIENDLTGRPRVVVAYWQPT